MAYTPDKGLTLMPGDIVNVPVGRGWRLAKVIEKTQGNAVKVRLKTGEMMNIKTDSIMTEDEVKSFRKAKGNTRVVRKGNLSEGSDEDSSGSSDAKKFLGLL